MLCYGKKEDVSEYKTYILLEVKSYEYKNADTMTNESLKCKRGNMLPYGFYTLASYISRHMYQSNSTFLLLMYLSVSKFNC